ncbi:MAG: hypothetical protein ACOYMP_03190 [Nodosilinea sp.]
MGLSVDQIQQRLARFEFQALFPAAMDCSRLDFPAGAPRLTVQIIEDWPVGSMAWSALIPSLPATDVAIALSRDGHRTLWRWSATQTASPPWRWRVGVRGLEDRAWALRLSRLQDSSYGQLPGLGSPLNAADRPPTPAQIQGFQTSWQALTLALDGLPQMTQRRHYALVLLNRLIALTVLQQRGFLAGDEWYLHNHFGQSQQQGRDRFFLDRLQPLCQQGLALPLEERSPSLHQRLGSLPFVPHGPFQLTALDQAWGQRPIADSAFEPALDWLGDALINASPGLVESLPILLEQVVNSHTGNPMVTPEPIWWCMCDRTIHATLLDHALRVTGQAYGSVAQLLMEITPAQAGTLLVEMGKLCLLDPACGSGRYLWNSLEEMIYLAQTLAAIASLETGVVIPTWAQPHGNGLAIYRHLASHAICGLDNWAPALEIARLQGFLLGLGHSTRVADLATFPDLSLTVLEGNALIGLIQVDSERFDQIGSRRGRPSPPVEVAQGNLIQPLLAQTYQRILAERQVRLEHYRSQTQLLAETGTVPDYAQAAFLRDGLEEVNQTAQTRLTQVLWQEASQQLGIRLLHQNQDGSRRRGGLELAAVTDVHPFHWGFYFHTLLAERGGFDMIISQFPGGTVQPTDRGFLDYHQDILGEGLLSASSFLNNPKQALALDPDLTRAWQDYSSQFSWQTQYFRRSTCYPWATQGGSGRIYWSRLFLERSLALLRPGGRCGVMADPFWAQANAAGLGQWLRTTTNLGGVVDLSNHQGIWPELSLRTQLCLVWLHRQGQSCHPVYHPYNQKSSAPTQDSLAILLQGLIDLDQ